MTSITTTTQRLSGVTKNRSVQVAAALVLAGVAVLLVLAGPLSGHTLSHDLQHLPAPAQHLLGPSLNHYLVHSAR